MNYTRPQSDEDDTTEIWLSTMLIFANALGNILKETEGIVVEVKGDMKLSGIKSKNVIVFRKDGQIRIDEADDNLESGTMIWVDYFCLL